MQEEAKTKMMTAEEAASFLDLKRDYVYGRGVAVERPRASDAIGTALRNAFDREAGLPSDMMRLLRCLDSAGDRTGARPRAR